jgi:hypothetical protein
MKGGLCGAPRLPSSDELDALAPLAAVTYDEGLVGGTACLSSATICRTGISAYGEQGGEKTCRLVRRDFLLGLLHLPFLLDAAHLPLELILWLRALDLAHKLQALLLLANLFLERAAVVEDAGDEVVLLGRQSVSRVVSISTGAQLRPITHTLHCMKAREVSGPFSMRESWRRTLDACSFVGGMADSG